MDFVLIWTGDMIELFNEYDFDISAWWYAQHRFTSVYAVDTFNHECGFIKSVRFYDGVDDTGGAI